MFENVIVATAIKQIRDKRSELGPEEVEELEIYLARDLLEEIWRSPVINRTIQEKLLMDVFGKRPCEFEADVSSCFAELPETLDGAPVMEFNPIVNCFFALVIMELHVREMEETSFAASFDDHTIDYLAQLLEGDKLHQKFFPSRLIEFGRAVFCRFNDEDPLNDVLRFLEIQTVTHLVQKEELKALSRARGWIRNLPQPEQQSNEIIESDPEPIEVTDEPNADSYKSSVDEIELASAATVGSRGENTKNKNRKKKKKNNKENKQNMTGKELPTRDKVAEIPTDAVAVHEEVAAYFEAAAAVINPLDDREDFWTSSQRRMNTILMENAMNNKEINAKTL